MTSQLGSQTVAVTSPGKSMVAAASKGRGIGRGNFYSLTALGVVINDRLTAADHVSSLLICSRLLYALRVLRNHGIPAASMNDVFGSTVLANLLYCSPAWSGFCSAADRARLDAFLRRCQRLGYCSRETPAITKADETLFGSILANSNYVLQSYLPERSLLQYT